MFYYAPEVIYIYMVEVLPNGALLGTFQLCFSRQAGSLTLAKGLSPPTELVVRHVSSTLLHTKDIEEPNE